MVVSFFGHKDTPVKIKPLLEKTLERLISENAEITFLVGTHGNFDLIAQTVLQQAADLYKNISCYIVLPCIPTEKGSKEYRLMTIIPEGIENVPKKYGISFRNKYMVKECDTVVCYITHSWGGAAQFTGLAAKQGKTIINLAEK